MPQVTVIVAHEQKRRTRKTSVLAARYESVTVSLLLTSWHGVTLATQTTAMIMMILNFLWEDVDNGQPAPQRPLT